MRLLYIYMGVPFYGSSHIAQSWFPWQLQTDKPLPFLLLSLPLSIKYGMPHTKKEP